MKRMKPMKNRATRYLILIVTSLLITGLNPTKAEDWMWWNKIHNWKPGMPSWKYFIKVSPGYLGPNALPVPDQIQGLVGDKIQFQTNFSSHFSDGDNTQDLSLRFYYPFIPGKVALELYGVAFEHYSMSTKVRDERAARDFDGKGFAIGDLYFATHIQLRKDKKGPDMALRLVGRTASGGAYDAARYSDSPGYFFDLSFGKYFHSNGLNKWRWFGTLGFKSWQTSSDEILQNDAGIYGFGLKRKSENSSVSVEVAGYVGYKDERDRPMVARVNWSKKMGNNKLFVGFQQGIYHIKYSTIRIGWIWEWNKNEL
ncbi:hypothetical protein EMN47_13820 [Prolixibacteraceae bacterium JC049]|nr:hypothetical protein [Prolixibacteraceae bacterium JC049]